MSWIIEASELYEHATYACVHIPDSELAAGNGFQILHLWSIHTPPLEADHNRFWNSDVPGLSRLDAAAPAPGVAGIIGADWNVIISSPLDEFPAWRQTDILPIGQLVHAGFANTFCTLHPLGVSFTRHNILCSKLMWARQIDSVWMTHDLIPSFLSVNTYPSMSDHSFVSVNLCNSATQKDLGPGIWQLHCYVHLQPGFQLHMHGYADQLHPDLQSDPVAAWYHFVEHICSTTANVLLQLSQQSKRLELQHILTLQQLNTLDIC